MFLKAMLLSLITGLGHIYMRRYLQGVFLFFLFAASLNTVFLASLWQDETTAVRILYAAGAMVAIVWIYGLYSVYRITYGTDRVQLAEERDRRYKRAFTHYLGGEYKAALDIIRSVLDLDVDRREADAHFYMGVFHNRLGNRKKAKRCFRRCKAMDMEGKWSLEIRWELERDRD
jgi:hypothetical protein